MSNGYKTPHGRMKHDRRIKICPHCKDRYYMAIDKRKGHKTVKVCPRCEREV